MRNNWLVLFVFFGLALISCDNESEMESEPKPRSEYERNTSLIGEWKWQRSYNGWGGEYTPEETDTELFLTFMRNDSVIIENSNTIFKAEYYVKKDSSWYTSDITNFLYIKIDTAFQTKPFGFFIITSEPPDNRFIIQLSPNALKLLEECFDCSDHTFKRISK
jgi:hypothetical protein